MKLFQGLSISLGFILALFVGVQPGVAAPDGPSADKTTNGHSGAVQAGAKDTATDRAKGKETDKAKAKETGKAKAKERDKAKAKERDEEKRKEKGKKEEAKPQDPLNSATFADLKLRSIGPASSSGRISDLVVDPTDHSRWYVAVASGGVWKTVNAGTTWTPIFDDQGSYSIGCIAVDPHNPLNVWVGTGENNSQRSVGYGDGVYKSLDGGRTWEKAGLEKSEHIGKIVIDPRRGATVYVCAQGPLWGPGGDRGLYKTTDAGKTWVGVLEISENTGVSDLIFDPRDPDVLYASAYQRRRHVWTLIDGGPESAIYKSTDAGGSWRKLANGLPKNDVGRIGLALAPSNPDLVYAIIEATGEETGFYRSRDAGGSWERTCPYITTSPQYYQEIFVDPKNPDRVYSMDTWMMVTEDGGASFKRVGEKHKHVDNHALWIDPEQTEHLIAGCDGGVYETFDRGANWRFFQNLPVTQFYRVSVDESSPFYYVYGGTQDNASLGGPSRTVSASGIVNSDWFITQGGDGFKTVIDPLDPNIVYAQSQHAGLCRFDRRSGESVDIQPQPGPEEPALRWNWDTPLIISPHSPLRLYIAANRVFQSNDRGDSWTAISPDLTRQLDRNQLPVMGRIWSIDAVAKNASTSFYGNLVSLAESPRRQGLLFAGSDDGLIQVSENGGGAWTRGDEFPGVFERSYVSCLTPSQHDENVVYAAFDNHKMADFKPYLLRSEDRGRSWSSVAGDLPVRGSVYSLVEDHVDPNLLFCGTEFGLYFTLDRGQHWVRLQGGMPVISVRDLAIQRRESDLAVASFGRGIYLLDDYTPLRGLTRADLDREAILFQVRKTWMYIESTPLGGDGPSAQGDGFYTAPNPPLGATFTWYLREGIKSLKEERQEREKKLIKENKEVPYPSWEALREETREEAPQIVFTVTDASGQVVRRLTTSPAAGMHRITWDLRYPPSEPVSLEVPKPDWGHGPEGPMVAPGTYTVTMATRVRGLVTPLDRPQTFETVPLGTATLAASDRTALLAFQKQAAELQRAVRGAVKTADEAQERLEYLRKGLADLPQADARLRDSTLVLSRRLQDLRTELQGDRGIAEHEEPTPPAIEERVQRIVGSLWSSTSAPTKTVRDDYAIVAEAFPPVLSKLRVLIEIDLADVEREAEAAGLPWTPGRVPRWPR